MKKLIMTAVFVLIYTGSAYAAPNIVSDSFTSSMVDNCVIVLDGATHKFVPTPTTTGQSRCEFDASTVSEGAHNMSFAAENMWGVSEPAPFDFTKELPPNLSNIRLEK